MTRLITTIEGPQAIRAAKRIVKVYYDRERAEYQCRLNDGGKNIPVATYFTDDGQDAIDTAKAMASITTIQAA